MIYEIIRWNDDGSIKVRDEEGDYWDIVICDDNGVKSIRFNEYRCIDCTHNIGCEYDEQHGLMVGCALRRNTNNKTRGMPYYMRRRSVSELDMYPAYEYAPCPFYNLHGDNEDIE